jgi:hypothetical protein
MPPEERHKNCNSIDLSNVLTYEVLVRPGSISPKKRPEFFTYIGARIAICSCFSFFLAVLWQDLRRQSFDHVGGTHSLGGTGGRLRIAVLQGV